jgi:hypothetical protein
MYVFVSMAIVSCFEHGGAMSGVMRCRAEEPRPGRDMPWSDIDIWHNSTWKKVLHIDIASIVASYFWPRCYEQAKAPRLTERDMSIQLHHEIAKLNPIYVNIIDSTL